MALRKRDVADRMHSAAIHLLRRLREADAKTGMTPARLSVLSVLVFGGPCTLSDLAKTEGVTAPTMTRLVQGLESDGFVVRRSDSDDRRAVILYATKRGAKTLQDGRARRVQAFEALLERATPTDIQTLDRAARLIEELALFPRSSSLGNVLS
jgi:DNA-binding MarR family transcriptional regulator